MIHFFIDRGNFKLKQIPIADDRYKLSDCSQNAILSRVWVPLRHLCEKKGTRRRENGFINYGSLTRTNAEIISKSKEKVDAPHM